MRTTVQECFEAYVVELTEYREWIDATAKKYRQEAPNSWEWGDHDFEKAQKWNAGLALVRKILGVNEDEDKRADRLAGIIERVSK